MHTVDIVLPAYNPLSDWENVVINRFLSLEKLLPGCQCNLIVVNDGSTTIDETLSRQRLAERINRLQWISYSLNKGKGFALRKGVENSAAEFIIYTDIDWPYTEDSMKGLIENLILDADVIIGVRDKNYFENLPVSRRMISNLLKNINTRMLRLKIADSQAGLKGFRKEVRPVFLATTINRYLFDLEFIFLVSTKTSFRIKSYPITLRSGITFSKMNPKILFQESYNFLKLWYQKPSPPH